MILICHTTFFPIKFPYLSRCFSPDLFVAFTTFLCSLSPVFRGFYKKLLKIVLIMSWSYIKGFMMMMLLFPLKYFRGFRWVFYIFCWYAAEKKGKHFENLKHCKYIFRCLQNAIVVVVEHVHFEVYLHLTLKCIFKWHKTWQLH